MNGGTVMNSTKTSSLFKVLIITILWLLKWINLNPRSFHNSLGHVLLFLCFKSGSYPVTNMGRQLVIYYSLWFSLQNSFSLLIICNNVDYLKSSAACSFTISFYLIFNSVIDIITIYLVCWNDAMKIGMTS